LVQRGQDRQAGGARQSQARELFTADINAASAAANQS
jgi:hypothetical protein